jgi:hypothetical protein
VEGVLQHLEPHGGAGEVEAEGLVLLLEPGGADAEDGPALRHHVEGGDDLGQQRRVPVGDAGDQGGQVDGAGAGGQTAEQRVGLQHLLLGRAEHGQLEEVVHDEDRVEARLLGGLGGVDEDVEQLGGGSVGEREVGKLEPRFDHGLQRRPTSGG